MRLTLSHNLFEPSTSALPKSRTFLNREHVSRKIEHFTRGGRVNIDLLDFLLGELLPEYRWHIVEFYEDDGKPLRDLHTPRELAELDNRLLTILKAIAAVPSKLEPEWWMVREAVRMCG